ncbi:hypothetical protein O6H91_04G106800 [Diphasiastrum complanatum]|uniref:Uncharacterized protein n=1 Tax=Diphasiastrum complanatum TaxID=34168 RepID=A0ACC2E0A2_DIPCM|nr:hypothetical protein O6H91_04G106800 [Diphasiastrum complanatum]
MRGSEILISRLSRSSFRQRVIFVFHQVIRIQIHYNEILGKGAVKTVYRAFDRIDGIEVAWNQAKLEDLLRNPEDLERFYAEVHLLKSLKHKNIIKFYNSWMDTRNINFITEIFTSGTLRQYRERHKHVDLKAVKYWARQILRGLLYLHSHDPSIIHRDLKCDNIFINGNIGEVKIGDFGLAAILFQSRAARSVLGTPEFMAPELYEEEYNELVDIYSFGMCLLEMITSEYPYSECTNAAQIYKKVTAGKKPAALERVKDPSARAFIEKCLEKANRRPPARELLMDPFLLCADLEATGCMRFINQSDIRRKDIDIGGADWEELCYDTISGEDSLSSSWDPKANNAAVAQGNAIFEGCRPGVAVSSCVPSTLDGACRRSSDDSCDSWTVGGPVDQNPFSSSLSSETENSGSNVIMLGLRFVNPEGQVRSIRFPFDVEGDTALSVASEMVHELNLPDQDVSLVAELIDLEIKAVNPAWKTGPAFDDLMASVPSIEEEVMEQSKLEAIYKTAEFSPSTSLTSQAALFSPVPTKKNFCFSTKDNVALSSTRPECTMHGRFEEVNCLFNRAHSLHRTNEQNNFPCMLSENQVGLDLTEETSFTICSKVDNSCASVHQHDALSSLEVIQEDAKYPKSPAKKSDNPHTMTEAEHSKYTSKSSRVVDSEEYVELPPSEIYDGCCKSFNILTERVHDINEQLKPASLYREMTSCSEDEDASLLFASELKLLDQAYQQELRALHMKHKQALLQLKSRYRHGRSLGSSLSVCSDDQQVNGTMCAMLQDSSHLAPSSDSNDPYTSRSEKNDQLGCEAGKVKASSRDYSNFVVDYRLPVCETANCQTPMFSEKAILPWHGNQRKSASKETGRPWSCSPRFDLVWSGLDTVDRQDGLEQENCHSQLDESVASVGLLVGGTSLDCS